MSQEEGKEKLETKEKRYCEHRQQAARNKQIEATLSVLTTNYEQLQNLKLL